VSALQITRPAGHDHSVFVVSVSGGKDSTATVLALREADIPARYVFADTGWEAPQTYDYLATLERLLGIVIARVGHPGGMLALADKKAGFPSRQRRWCTEKLKADPIKTHLARLADEVDGDTVSVVGIRAEESEKRAAMPVFECSDLWGGYVWRPLLRWTVADVLAIHHRHGVPVNPLYKLGFERVGCMPCINESKNGVRLLAEHFPERIALLREREAAYTAERARRNATGEGEFTVPRATFFMPRTPGVLAPIDDVVAWSRTARGGRQLPLIQEDPDGGCFRWGLCEPPMREGADE
jgi:3'-phosphoadenosine 5'-phosphosulfate sulfotransferase (PAPS reductase)/FAD synthetase